MPKLFRQSLFSSLLSALTCYALMLLLLPLPRAAGESKRPTSEAHLPATSDTPSASWREGEVLIRFRSGVSAANKERVLNSRGARRKKQLRGESAVEKLEVLGGQNVATAALQLSLNPEVEFAEPNFLIDKDDVLTSDPKFGEQWALRNTGQNGAQFGSDINVTTAWQTTTGLASTTIAVIDSGIDLTHPELTNNRWQNPTPGPFGDVNGWDYITESGVIKDEQGHGTAIAGIIAAQGNNGIGITGVMWRAGLMSLRVLDHTGTGDVANAVEAIDYAVAHGAEVINLSWGTAGYSRALKDAIERAMRRGVVVVCSAGNTGQNIDGTPYYPAAFGLRELISVAATDNFDQLTTWSAYGPGNVTLAAPGTNILTTQIGGGYSAVSGTSASAPLVTGVAGLMQSLNPRLSPRSTAKAINDGARKVASLTNKVASGGVVDAGAALLQVRRNPYSDSHGNQGGNGAPYVPAGLQNADSRGRSHSGRRETPPPPIKGAPLGNLPNLGQLRRAKREKPSDTAPIEANLPCADCDPQSGGGGSQYYPTDDPNFSTARSLLINETGSPNVDLGSRNFNWSQTLLSLSGRAGLDLNLTLFYNSLVWTKSGSFMKYNADLGTPAPGFRLGLPILQRKFLNSRSGSNSYFMVTPSGGHVELREQSVGLYESVDGNHTQLKEDTTYYSLVARHSLLSAAVTGSSTANGAQIVQFGNPGGDVNFEWKLVPTDSGYYQLENHNSGKVAAVSGASQANNANVVQWDWINGTHEQWKIHTMTNGYYRLEARHSGRFLQVAAGSGVPGAFLQQATSNQNASHQQWRLVPVSTGVTVRTSDGTQYTFVRVINNSEYRCTQIKDRNGNIISATYDTNNGHLQTITDTLGRVITFVYYADGNLQTIRQTWAGADHDWATFIYGQVTVVPAFSGNFVVNGPNGNAVTILTRVNLHDGSSYRFDYNNNFGQVKQINHYAADDHILSYTAYNVDASAGQTDCPRFTQRKAWAKYWNGDTDGTVSTNEESVSQYAVAADDSWSKVTAPDGTVYKEFYATTGWQTGMTTETRNYANAADETADAAGQAPQLRKKRTTVTWTQDDEGLGFPKNPRVAEANVYDAEGNRKRVTINYGAYAAYNLPYEVSEYANDGTTIIRRTLTDYNLSSTYLDRRIIGLVSAVNVIDHATSATVSKTTFEYDWTGEYLVAMPQTPTQHDSTNYGSSFVAGRGNRSVVLRWDVTDINNASKAIQQQRMGYNSTGSTVFVRDGLSHQITLGYADQFSDSVDRHTFAFPTVVADAEGHQSFTKYNFDFGAVTWKQTPAPEPNQTAPTSSFTYDSEGRTQRITNDVNGAFSEWVYPNTMTEVNQFTTIAPGSITNANLRAFSTTLFDGDGRTRLTASELPPTANRYSAQRTIYDSSGRLFKQSNPTEVNAIWEPAGDDTAWFDTQQAYDWKGRTTLITNPDGTTRELTYGGCGCAGGEVITAADEKGRKRKLTKDNLGRLAKVEELNWDASTYATTLYSYNVRDQLTQSSQALQLRSFAYDGYGRMLTRTTPEQGSTNYTYNVDDTVATVTDARGAKTIFGYNPRHLVTSVSYDLSNLVSGQSVAATQSVSFDYDDAGNRTSMDDGLGEVTYVYDNLSQLTSETRTFDGLDPATLEYAYNPVGQLESLSSPWGTVNYGYDKVGRVTGVTDGESLNYATSLSYRAFGGIKGMNYGDGESLSTSYDNRLRLTKWDVSDVLGYNYTYNNTYQNEPTARVSYAQSIYNDTLDRSYQYDHVGRLIISHSGEEARAHVGLGTWGTYDGPYSQGYDYDVWGNITRKYGWGGEVQGGSPGQNGPDVNRTYTNNRVTDPAFSYDAAGNLTDDLGQTFTYDATGQQASAAYAGYSLAQGYDGDRLRVKKTENESDTYYLRSTVLGGQIIASFTAASELVQNYVYLGGQLLAVRYPGHHSVILTTWVHEDPVTKSKRITSSGGDVVSAIELDPWGADTSRSIDAAFQPRKFTTYDRDENGSDEAMFRRYNRWHSRFDQPDPYNGAYDLNNPQSFNRYSYVQGDPVNSVDPSGLLCISVHFTNINNPSDNFWTTPSCTPNDPYSDYYQGRDRPVGGGRQGPAPGFDRELGEPPSMADLLLTQQDCANFISELMSIAATLSTSTTTPSFAPMVGAGGQPEISYTPQLGLNEYSRAVREGRVTASGVSGMNAAGTVLTYGQTRGHNTITWNTEFYALSPGDNGRQVIHESLHLIQGFTDQALAGAAHIMATRTSNSPGNRGSFTSGSATSPASIYLNGQIAQHCGGG